MLQVNICITNGEMKQLVTWQGANSYQTKENDSIDPNRRIPGVCLVPTYKGRHLKRKGLEPGQTRSGDYFWNLSQWGWKEKENHYWEETGSELKSKNQGKGKNGRTSEKAGGQTGEQGLGWGTWFSVKPGMMELRGLIFYSQGIPWSPEIWVKGGSWVCILKVGIPVFI